LALGPIQDDGIRLRNRYLKLRKNLFLFLDDPRISPTNNTSEQAIRWSVIFREITNGFGLEWVKDLFTYVSSIVNTGKRQGLSMLDSILIALDPLKSLFPVS
jgi:transposase